MGAAVTRKEYPFDDDVALTCAARRSRRFGGTTGRGSRVEGVELLQQGFHLTLHSFSSSGGKLAAHKTNISHCFMIRIILTKEITYALHVPTGYIIDSSQGKKGANPKGP